MLILFEGLLALAAGASAYAYVSAYYNERIQRYGGLIGFILSVGFMGLLIK